VGVYRTSPRASFRILFAVAPEEAFLLLLWPHFYAKRPCAALQVVDVAVSQPPGGSFNQVHEHVTMLLFSGLDGPAASARQLVAGRCRSE
jgi:hypothetical protein